MTEYERLKLKIADLKDQIKQLQDQRDNFYRSMLLWRNIDTEQGDIVCKKCSGSGVAIYGDTSTWRGGYGGQMMTADICDECWGSGKQNNPWTNLRSTALRHIGTTNKVDL